MMRCQGCKKFTKNNTAKLNRFREMVTDPRGDCKRCGAQVPITYDSWEDWGWGDAFS